MYTGYPDCEINLLSPVIKLSVDKFPKSYKRAARVVRRVKAVLQRFAVAQVYFVFFTSFCSQRSEIINSCISKCW